MVLNRTPRARNGSDSAIAIVIKIFIRRESAAKIGGKPIRTKTRHLLSSLRFTHTPGQASMNCVVRRRRCRERDKIAPESSGIDKEPLLDQCFTGKIRIFGARLERAIAVLAPRSRRESAPDPRGVKENLLRNTLASTRGRGSANRHAPSNLATHEPACSPNRLENTNRL